MNNLHLFLQPQLESIIDELIFKSHARGELLDCLCNINWWWDESPYNHETIHLDGFEGTFKHLLRMVDIITNDETLFNLDLIQQLQITIEARWEIHMRLKQEDY